MAELQDASPFLKHGGDEQMDYEKELKFLETVLKKVQDKFINQWTGSQFETTLSQQGKQHAETMETYKSKLSSVRADIENLKSQKERDSRTQANQTEEVQEIQEKLKKVQSEAERIMKQQRSQLEEFNKLKEENAKLKEWVESENKLTDMKQNELDQAISLFKDRLNLQIKKVAGERLQFVFTAIDNRHHDRPFCFCVKINKDRTYSISDCDPEIPAMDELMSKLNKTNDFRSFVIAMRQQFKQIAYQV